MLSPLALAARLISSFGLGLATPLTAVCVIPLYPGFVAYLARERDDGGGTSIAAIGALIAAGVLSFMLALGVVFTTVLQRSLTGVIEVVSPLAFLALAVFSVALMADVDVGSALPHIEPPRTGHPLLSAFGYGFFFGAIVIPCNPGFIAVFFARAFLFRDPVASLLNFAAFGLGIVLPLLVLAFASDRWSQRLLGVLRSRGSAINRATGVVMFAVAVYYLVFVFGVV